MAVRCVLWVVVGLLGQELITSSADDLPYADIVKRLDEYTLPELGFEKGELEPFVDDATVAAHHGGHHRAYTNKLNAVLKEWRSEEPKDALATGSILTILQNLELVPNKYKTAIRNQGGGYLNHCFYWATMSGDGDDVKREPIGSVGLDISRTFGSFAEFQTRFNAMAGSLFGSGYVWLSRDESGELMLTTSANQDSPVSHGFRPLLVIDVWEHAYYLRHQFRRADYIADWWKVVDWAKVAALDEWWKSVDTFTDMKDEL